MSVSPDDPRHLPPFRRPPEHGGTGRDPVFELDEQVLGSDLVYRPDPLDPERHGFIEPAREMAIDEFQLALAATQASWSWRRHPS